MESQYTHIHSARRRRGNSIELKKLTNKLKALALVVLTVLLIAIVSSRAKEEAQPTPPPGNTDNSVVTGTPAENETPGGWSEETITEPVEEEPELPDIDLSSWEYKLVNTEHPIGSSFAPDVSPVQDGQYVDDRIVEPLGSMIAAAVDQGFTVCVKAAYRPYSTQAYLFNGKASQIAWPNPVTLADEAEARKIVAYPGTSEHQLGLCVDLLESASSAYDAEVQEHADMLVWMREHCAEFGFIARYPKDKAEITGWYEPWHFRYVGVEAARYITENGLCLEEFLMSY